MRVGRGGRRGVRNTGYSFGTNPTGMKRPTQVIHARGRWVGSADIEKGSAMAGKIKQMLEEIVRQRSATNSMMAGIVRTKLLLKGLDSAKFDASSPDDPIVIRKIVAAASEMGVTLK